MRKSTRAHLAGQHESLDSGQTVYWEAQTQDAFGNIIDEDYGNNTTTVRGFDGVTGRIDYIDTKNGALQDLTYTWDKVGNLLSRKDWRQSGNPTENFVYDTLNRMTDADISGAATLNLNVTYDENGNIEKKDDVTSSTWGYHANNKHAVTSAGWNSYSYDANGNMTSRKGDTITWTSYNYPSEIDDGPRTYQYSYDAGRQKWKQVYDDGSSSETTYFAGRLFEKNVNSSDTDHRHYIMANGRAVAVFVERSSQYNYVRYLTHDHLGSTDGIVTETGVMQVAESFSAFGERRDPIDWIGDPSAGDQILIANRMDRGYTDHINLEKSSLIHMNGRVYDAEIGRFLSPDPYVFQPMNTQGFNRYAYVQNNPMRYTDPSGFCLDAGSCIGRFLIASGLNFLSGLFGGDDKKPPNFCKDNVDGCGGPAPNQMAKMDAGHYPDLPGDSSQADESIGSASENSYWGNVAQNFVDTVFSDSGQATRLGGGAMTSDALATVVGTEYGLLTWLQNGAPRLILESGVRMTVLETTVAQIGAAAVNTAYATAAWGTGVGIGSLINALPADTSHLGIPNGMIRDVVSEIIEYRLTYPDPGPDISFWDLGH